MRTLFKVLAVTLALLMCCMSALANEGDDSLTRVKIKQQLILGFDKEFAPMGYIDEHDNVVGFDIDVAAEVCARLGKDIVLVPYVIEDWDTKENLLKDGTIDCIWNGLSFSPDRFASMRLSTPYMNNDMVLVVRADSGIMVKEQLDGKKLGIQAGSTAAEALDEKSEFKSILAAVKSYATNDEALKELEKGDLDAVLLDQVVADWYITVNEADLVCLEESLLHEEYAIGFRKDDDALAEEVEKKLMEMVKDGTLAKISEKWFGRDLTTLKEYYGY